MTEAAEYVSHRAVNPPHTHLTACGEPWQGWQAPELARPEDVVSPHAQPVPDRTRIRPCRACLRRINR